MASALENEIHGRMEKMFPFLIVPGGWKYKGFGISRDDGRNVLNFRFEKKIVTRSAFAVLHVFADTLDIPGYDLRAWMIEQLEQEEARLTAQFAQEFAGGA